MHARVRVPKAEENPSQLTHTADTGLCSVMRCFIHTWLHPDSKGSVHLTCIATPPTLSEKAPKEKAEFNLIIHCEQQCQRL